MQFTQELRDDYKECREVKDTDGIEIKEFIQRYGVLKAVFFNNEYVDLPPAYNKFIPKLEDINNRLKFENLTMFSRGYNIASPLLFDLVSAPKSLENHGNINVSFFDHNWKQYDTSEIRESGIYSGSEMSSAYGGSGQSETEQSDESEEDDADELTQLQSGFLYELKKLSVRTINGRRRLCADTLDNTYIPLPERYSNYIAQRAKINLAFNTHRCFIIFIPRGKYKPTFDIKTIPRQIGSAIPQFFKDFEEFDDVDIDSLDEGEPYEVLSFDEKNENQMYANLANGKRWILNQPIETESEELTSFYVTILTDLKTYRLFLFYLKNEDGRVVVGCRTILRDLRIEEDFKPKFFKNLRSEEIRTYDFESPANYKAFRHAKVGKLYELESFSNRGELPYGPGTCANLLFKNRYFILPKRIYDLYRDKVASMNKEFEGNRLFLVYGGKKSLSKDGWLMFDIVSIPRISRKATMSQGLKRKLT